MSKYRRKVNTGVTSCGIESGTPSGMLGLRTDFEAPGTFTDYNGKVWNVTWDETGKKLWFENGGVRCDADAYAVQMGGKKTSVKKATKKRFSYKGHERVVYVGGRGGEYIKLNGKYTSIKQL